ncbi:MAG: preprotein translocase subunit SecE [Clostridia bacterium]|nr:preprotein translocase subunit SecE [Clostridia bacterium]
MAGTKTKQSGLQRLTKFFKETKAELRKVTWPSKDQLVHNTSIIIAFIIIFTVILSVLDFGFQELFGWFANLIG